LVVELALVVVVGLVEKRGIGWCVEPGFDGMVGDKELVVVGVVVVELGGQHETPCVFVFDVWVVVL
jgi:hypothetical protein